MMSLSKERKERRLQSYDGMMMTRRGYNAALCGLLLYGIAANFIICKYFTDAVEALNPTAFLIGYLVCAIITMARKTAANLNTHHLDLRI